MADTGTGDRGAEGAAAAPPPELAALAAPARIAGSASIGLAVLVFVAVSGLVLAGETQPEPGLLFGPALFLGIGVLLRVAARRFADGTLDLPRLGGILFTAFGAAVALIGAVMAYDDPAGFAVVAFGSVFIGIGILVRRVFAPPPGKKAVLVGGAEAPIRTLHGRRGIRRQASVIHVDENASAAEIEAAKAAWLRERWAQRPDWAEGRILAEESRGGPMLKLAAALWILFALAGLAGALYSNDWLAWLIAAGSGVVAVALFNSVVLQSLRQRKFKESRLLLRESPATLGRRLLGEIETGVPQSMVLPDGFRLVLRCIHRWQETRRTDGAGSSTRTIYHRDVLWEGEQLSAGHAPAGSGNLTMPVSFLLPTDRPATTLDGGMNGFFWELEISAALPGLDYLATFKVPVLEPEAVRLLRGERATGHDRSAAAGGI
ncbi:MAG: hypothetical protein IRZ04_00015 [Rhodospirillales bacterium]|nr:hypothetical protein [Rhodospirillales bacterium]